MRSVYAVSSAFAMFTRPFATFTRPFHLFNVQIFYPYDAFSSSFVTLCLFLSVASFQMYFESFISFPSVPVCIYLFLTFCPFIRSLVCIRLSVRASRRSVRFCHISYALIRFQSPAGPKSCPLTFFPSFLPALGGKLLLNVISSSGQSSHLRLEAFRRPDRTLGRGTPPGRPGGTGWPASRAGRRA